MSQWKGYGPDNVLPSEAGVIDVGPQSAANAGTLTYEPYYGLKAKPFSLSTDPRTLYKSPTHASVFEDLLGAIRRREGLIVLTGEMGTGKTTLCRAALYQLDRKTFTTFVPDPFLSREDLLRMLLVDFGEVSVDDLRRGRLSGASRPDLSYQLFEFLTSLESVDAFAVLVIDEAQHLAPPLLDEIRALSELEAGRRLLQVVLVGQPELQSHLKQPQMRQIDQRVTMRCELRPLTKDDVAGYVAHRLATAGGARERIAFAPAAIEMIHAASSGIPRLVNVICDRALALGYVERTSLIGLELVAGAIDELRLTPLRDQAVVQPSTPEPKARPARPSPSPRGLFEKPSPSPRGLFEKKPPSDGAASQPSDLASLLDLPTTTPRRESEGAPDQGRLSPEPEWKTRVAREARHGNRFGSLRTAGLAVLGMAVMLIAGGMAVTAQRVRPVVAAPVTSPAASAAQPQVVPLSQPQAVAPQDTWVVQVGAYSSPERSLATVQRLTASGFSAFEVTADMGPRGLVYFVRVGPFKTAMDADDVRTQLRELADLEGAFVRNVTTKP